MTDSHTAFSHGLHTHSTQNVEVKWKQYGSLTQASKQVSTLPKRRQDHKCNETQSAAVYSSKRVAQDRKSHCRDLGRRQQLHHLGHFKNLTMASGNYRSARGRPKGPMRWEWQWNETFPQWVLATRPLAVSRALGPLLWVLASRPLAVCWASIPLLWVLAKIFSIKIYHLQSCSH